jgi:hypothetical protein
MNAITCIGPAHLGQTSTSTARVLLRSCAQSNLRTRVGSSGGAGSSLLPPVTPSEDRGGTGRRGPAPAGLTDHARVRVPLGPLALPTARLAISQVGLRWDTGGVNRSAASQNLLNLFVLSLACGLLGPCS